MRWTRQRPRARGDLRAGVEPVSDRRARRRTAVKRTAKSCGSGAPRLASSSRRQVGPTGRLANLNPRNDGDNKPGRRGEREVSRKTIACGNAGCSGGPVVTTLACLLHSCTRGCGCIDTRHSPRPRFLGRMVFGTRAHRATGSWGRIRNWMFEIESGICIFLPSRRRLAPARTSPALA